MSSMSLVFCPMLNEHVTRRPAGQRVPLVHEILSLCYCWFSIYSLWTVGLYDLLRHGQEAVVTADGVISYSGVVKKTKQEHVCVVQTVVFATKNIKI